MCIFDAKPRYNPGDTVVIKPRNLKEAGQPRKTAKVIAAHRSAIVGLYDYELDNGQTLDYLQIEAA